MQAGNVEALNARNRQHTSDMKSFALLDKLEQAKTESYDKEMAVGKQAEAKFRDAGKQPLTHDPQTLSKLQRIGLSSMV